MPSPQAPFTPRSAALRRFAGLGAVILAALAFWRDFFAGELVGAVLLAVGAGTIGLLGLVKPQALRPVYIGFMAVALAVGRAVFRLALPFLYYGVFTPLGYLLRLMGRDVLALRHSPRPSPGTGPERVQFYS